MQKQVSEEKSNALTQRDWFREYKCSKEETQKRKRKPLFGKFPFLRLSKGPNCESHWTGGWASEISSLSIDKLGKSTPKIKSSSAKLTLPTQNKIYASGTGKEESTQKALWGIYHQGIMITSISNKVYHLVRWGIAGLPKNCLAGNKPMKYFRASLDQLDH